MIIKNTSYSQFANEIKSKSSSIIVYGAGVLGQILAPYILKQYGLEKSVLYYVDADKGKAGMIVQLTTCSVIVKPVEELAGCPENSVILITNSIFYPVCSALDKIKELDDVYAYILPVMQLLEKSAAEKRVVKCNETPIIPKKIHYCWFSGNPIPPKLQRCMESWKKFCPDYEIIRWDESNYDVNKNLYVKQAYENKKWGYIPDIVRLEVLHEYGGIYLDTDVELVRNLDDLLYQEAFCGLEKWGIVNLGGGSGAVKGHRMIGRMLEFRVNEPFIWADGTQNLTSSGFYEMKPLIAEGLRIVDEVQDIDGLTVYPSEFFHPYDYMSGQVQLTENTFSIHHFNGSWLDENADENKRKTKELYKKMITETSDFFTLDKVGKGSTNAF